MDLLVLGVDGVAPEFLEQAMQKYDMEGWKQLKDEAAFAELPSTVPAVTIPAWVSMFSGYNPGKFEAYHLSKPDYKNWEMGSNTGSYPGINFWDRMEGKVALHNVPGTSPVYEVDGYMRGGFPSPKEYEFYPEQLQQEMEDLELEKEKTHEKASTRAKLEAEFKNYETEKEIMQRMMEKKVDAFVSVVKMTDDASHFAERKEDVFKSYRQVDQTVKEVVEKAESHDANLVVVSDHGFMKSKRKFNVVRFLAEEGFTDLDERKADESMIYKLVEPVMDTGLKRYFKFLHNIYRNETGHRLDGKGGDLFESIEKSSDVLPFHFGLGKDCCLKVHTEDMPHGHVSEEEKKEILDELEEELESLERNGDKVVKKIWKGDEIYSGDGLKPDIVFRTKDIPVETTPGSKMYPKTNTFTHDTNGIFFAKGPDIDEEAEIDIDIFDIAPLIYALLGEEIPDDLEGNVPENLVPEIDFKTSSTELNDISV